MSDEEDETIDIFQEPADYYKPEKPCTFQTHTLDNGQEITVRLIGFNPLWVHMPPPNLPDLGALLTHDP